jgi:hypothetical protein
VITATTSAALAKIESSIVLHAEPDFQKSRMWFWKTSTEDRSTIAITGRVTALVCSPLYTLLNTNGFVYTGKLTVLSK